MRSHIRSSRIRPFDLRAARVTPAGRRSLRSLTMAAAVAAALVLSGCGGDPVGEVPPPVQGPGAPTDTGEPGDTGNDPDAPGDVDEVTAGALAAIALAEETTGGVAYELDDEDDRAWKIDVNVDGSDVEVTVNRAGTEVLSSNPDGTVDDDDVRNLAEAEVSMREAIEAAAPSAGGHLEAVDLSTENGAVVWEVEFDDGATDWEVYVDARTAAIVKVEQD